MTNNDIEMLDEFIITMAKQGYIQIGEYLRLKNAIRRLEEIIEPERVDDVLNG